MKTKSRPIAFSAFAFVVLGICLPATSQAEEIWAVRGGATTVSFDAGVMERLGLNIGQVGETTSTATDRRWSQVFPIDPESELTFLVANGSVKQLVGDRILHFGELSVATSHKQLGLGDFVIAPVEGKWLDRLRITEAMTAQAGGFVLERIKVGFDLTTHTLSIHGGSLHLAPAWAKALGDPSLAEHALGTVTVRAPAEWVGGAQPELVAETPPTPSSRDIGPDMTFCQLYGLGQYGREGDIVGLSLATTSWNVGDAELMWHASPAEDHPFIIMDLFRLKTVNGSERFEQIGQSWIKHGFCALDSTQCGGSCQGTGCGTLGINCTDTYSAGLNASQGGLGPRYEVNPWTGEWSYAGSHFQTGGDPHDGISHRLQVYDDDLDPAQNPGATYYGGSYYVCFDDVDVMNSVSWKPVTVSGSPGGTWSFGMSGPGSYPNIGFGIDAWVGAQQTIIAQEVPPIEFVSPDGRCILAAQATDLGGGIWHYEYALLNVDMDRQVDLFSIPLPGGVNVSNVGFHAVHHHDEPVNEPGGVPIDNAPWTSDVGAGVVKWTTTTNPLRWGTMYNFRFDADADPGEVTVTLGLFKPGTPSSVGGLTVGPAGPPPVCGDGVVEGNEECDPPDGVHCDETCQWICGDGVVQEGEQCDPPDGITCDANCQRIPVCGDGVVEGNEECDPPDGLHCDETCQWICGDGVVQEGEDCDPPNGVTCDDNCLRIPTCGDGIVDPGEQCDPPDGVTCDENCQVISNDNCEAALPVCPGSYDGSTWNTTNDGSATCGASSASPDVWYSYTPAADGTLTAETCSSASYDTVLSVHSGCPGTSSNQLVCNDDACTAWRSRVTLAVTADTTYLIRVAGYSGGSGDFVLTVTGPECYVGDPIRGGLMWDKWWLVNGAPEPQGNHPLYPPEGQQSGSTTYRCKECHGWDYKGVDGAYGSGSHYTGIPGVYGSTMGSNEMFDLIKYSSAIGGHGFVDYGLGDQDIWDLVSFVQTLLIDTDSYIDSAGQFIGDPLQGETNYTNPPPSGGTACSICHGPDGTAINFGTPDDPEWVGTVAVANPWEMLHKTRFGQPGAPMMSWIEFGGTDQGAADLGLYAQLYFPAECIDASHCDDGDPCNGAEVCAGGYCESGPIECGEGCLDCNVNGIPDPCESYVVPGDLNSDCEVNLADFVTFARCYTGAMSTTPPPGCDPSEFESADLDGDSDVDLADFVIFVGNFGT